MFFIKQKTLKQIVFQRFKLMRIVLFSCLFQFSLSMRH